MNEQKEHENDTHVNDAMEVGDFELAKQLVRSGSDAGSARRYSAPPMFRAAAWNSISMLKFFIYDRRLDVNTIDANGDNLISHSIIYSSFNAIFWLLTQTAIKIPEEERRELMYTCSYAGRVDIISFLIKNRMAQHNCSSRALLQKHSKISSAVCKFGMFGGAAEIIADYAVLDRTGSCPKHMSEFRNTAMIQGKYNKRLTSVTQ